MIVNEGRMDRALRLLLGFAIVALGTMGPMPTTPSLALSLLGIFVLMTGALGWCPLYSLVGWATCPVPGRSSGPQRP